MNTKISATVASTGLLFVLATSWSWISLTHEAMGGEVSGPATIDCEKLGGVRYLKSCKKPLETTQRDIRLQGGILLRLGVALGITPKILVSYSDKTLNTTILFAELCNAWNACAISQEKYEKLIEKIISSEQTYFARVAHIQALKDEPTTKGAERSQAVNDFEARLEQDIQEIDRVASEIDRVLSEVRQRSE